MANMSYCRFQNTYNDFCDCVNALREDGIPESETEKYYSERLYNEAKEFINAYEEAKEFNQEDEDE